IITHTINGIGVLVHGRGDVSIRLLYKGLSVFVNLVVVDLLLLNGLRIGIVAVLLWKKK
ncbi:hypothetical protein QNZ59_004642, partial [Vibrio parahaemolyticus]|nr:hypothetical protein [Vibrio parahaemolyticus]ELB2100241.1 hypothetical protein [Vibrio parahaemolyticus]ELB2209966.1 hypothetical protein [Vibrio parahaemolyticus]